MSKAKPRQYGTGSVFQRSSDGRWVGVVQVGWNEKGRRRTIRVTAKTEKLVKEKLTLLQRQIVKDGVPEKSARVTVKAFAEDWISRSLTKHRPKTAQTYASQVRRWIIPTIGHRTLVQLNPGDIRAVTDAIRNAGRSTTTAKHAQTVLTSMLRSAIGEGHQVQPRLLSIDAPGKAVSDRDAIPPEVLQAILSRAAVEPDGSRWVAALLQGMRQGECLGLTWDAVDLVAGVIDVSWQLQALPRQDAWSRTSGFVVPDGYEKKQLHGALHLVRPKTSKGQRILPMVPWLTAALTAWRDVAPVSPHRLVWPRPDGKPRMARADLLAWKELQQVTAPHPSGREWLLHEARHTTATLLLENDIDPTTVTALLGHSSIVTSRGYQHVSQALARKAMDAVQSGVRLPELNPSR